VQKGVSFRLGADRDPTPAVIWRKQPADQDILGLHELIKAGERRPGIEEHEVCLRVRVGEPEAL